jgi:hypothetical protein
VTDDASRIWFVFFTRTVGEWGERGRSHPTLETLEQKWRLVGQAAFNDLEVMLFERR